MTGERRPEGIVKASQYEQEPRENGMYVGKKEAGLEHENELAVGGESAGSGGLGHSEKKWCRELPKHNKTHEEQREEEANIAYGNSEHITGVSMTARACTEEH